MKNGLYERIDKLKKLRLPEQRSTEWYEIRDKMLTASSLADALGKGHFKTRENLLIEKSSKEPIPRFTSDIIEWGVKYEPVATMFYEKMNNLTQVFHEGFKNVTIPTAHLKAIPQEDDNGV